MKITHTKITHTPGPWHIGRTITGSEESIQLAGITGDGQKKYDCFVVAPAYTVAGVGGIGKEECRANARLIAASPDLLKAVKDLLWVIEGTHIEKEGEYAKEIEFAKSIVSKAEAA